MKKLLLSTLALSGSLFAAGVGLLAAESPSSQLAFKGHTIGETFAEYAAKNGVSQADVLECRSLVIDRKEQRKRRHSEKYDACQILIGGLENQARFNLPVEGGKNWPRDKAVFENGRLIQFDFRIGNSSDGHEVWFQQVLRDMTARLGEPTARITLAGDDEVARWDEPEVYAEIMDITDHDSTDSPVTLVTVMSQAEHMRQALIEAKAKARDTLQ